MFMSLMEGIIFYDAGMLMNKLRRFFLSMLIVA